MHAYMSMLSTGLLLLSGTARQSKSTSYKLRMHYIWMTFTARPCCV